MGKDFRVRVNFFNHKKTIRLIRELGLEGPWYLLKLWAWARVHCPDGCLEDMTEQDISEAIGWPHDSMKFIGLLLEEKTRYMVRIDEKLCLYNWEKHNSWAAKSAERSEIARKNVGKRWEKKRQKEGKVYETDTECTGVPDTPSPSPSPSPLPSITSNEVAECLTLLKKIKGYKIKEDEASYINGLIQEYPEIDPVCLIKNWIPYISDNPFKKNASPRSAFRNQFAVKKKNGICKRESKGTGRLNAAGHEMEII